jgi:hypothetical protein
MAGSEVTMMRAFCPLRTMILMPVVSAALLLIPIAEATLGAACTWTTQPLSTLFNHRTRKRLSP